MVPLGGCNHKWVLMQSLPGEKKPWHIKSSIVKDLLTPYSTWNLKTTSLKRKVIFQTFILGASILVFQGVLASHETTHVHWPLAVSWYDLDGPQKKPIESLRLTQEARLQTCIDLLFLFLPLPHILSQTLTISIFKFIIFTTMENQKTKKKNRHRGFFPLYMGVSKNRGIPKWMVYNGKPY